MSNIGLKLYAISLGITQKRNNYYLLRNREPCILGSKIRAGEHQLSPPDLWNP